MKEHDEIFDLLTLAAAGALDAEEQRRVEEHLRGCPQCAAEFETWSEITGGLREIPTPSAPAGLVERTRLQLSRRATQKEGRWNRFFMAALILLAWALTFVTWPVIRMMGDGLVSWLNIPSTGITLALIVYTVVGLLATGVAAVFAARRHRQEGRVA